jgi:hypothetical protein
MFLPRSHFVRYFLVLITQLQFLLRLRVIRIASYSRVCGMESNSNGLDELQHGCRT